MKVFLDNIIYSKVKNGGVSNYWFELTKYLQTQSDIELKFFEDEIAFQNFHRKNLKIDPSQIINTPNIPILSRVLPVKYKTDSDLIYHSSYFRGLSGAKNRVEITTVYDFIHSYYASFTNKSMHNFLKFNAIKRSKGIICISNNTYSDLKKFCPLKQGQKATVIHVGVSDDYFPIHQYNQIDNEFIDKYNLNDDFILFIGGRTNYKNFDFVINAINDFSGLKLVVVGGGELNEREIGLFTKSGLERVVFISSVKNQELNIIYNKAVALLYPSSYEGFGIPVVEAMKAGCPVIGLNNATINEVASRSALLLNKLSITELQKHLLNIKNNDFKNNLIEMGFEDSKNYSWDKCSRETKEFYEEFL